MKCSPCSFSSFCTPPSLLLLFAPITAQIQRHHSRPEQNRSIKLDLQENMDVATFPLRSLSENTDNTYDEESGRGGESGRIESAEVYERRLREYEHEFMGNERGGEQMIADKSGLSFGSGLNLNGGSSDFVDRRRRKVSFKEEITEEIVEGRDSVSGADPNTSYGRRRADEGVASFGGVEGVGTDMGPDTGHTVHLYETAAESGASDSSVNSETGIEGLYGGM